MESVIPKYKKPDEKLDFRIGCKKTVSFGQKGASDYTKHKDNERNDAYIYRHKKNEDWIKPGVTTAGWMSKHVRWNKPRLRTSKCC